MKKAVKCKLATTPEQTDALLETLVSFASACNLILAKSKELGRHAQYALHTACYYNVKERTGLQANYVVRAIKRVSSSFGKRKKPPQEFKPTSLDLDARVMAYDPANEIVSLSTIRGRCKIQLALGDYQRQQLHGQHPKAGTLIFDEARNRFYINLVIELETPEPTGDTPLGIDRGINRIAADSQEHVYSGKKLKQKRATFARVRASLQRAKAQRTRSRNVYRVLKRLSGRERRYTKDVNHCISRKTVRTAKAGNYYIVMEDLTGIRNGKLNRKGKTLRTLLNSWPHHQLGMFVAYKSAETGVPVKYIPGAWTSQTHWLCGRIGVRSGHLFFCEFCGVTEDADINAAKMIARLGAALYQPARLAEPLCCSYGQHSQNALHAAASNSILSAQH